MKLLDIGVDFRCWESAQLGDIGLLLISGPTRGALEPVVIQYVVIFLGE